MSVRQPKSKWRRRGINETPSTLRPLVRDELDVILPEHAPKPPVVTMQVRCGCRVRVQVRSVAGMERMRGMDCPGCRRR